MNTNDAITLARKHAGNGMPMESSARLCLADAVALQERGELAFAAEKARKSLGYSVGVFHNDYRRVDTFVKTRVSE